MTYFEFLNVCVKNALCDIGHTNECRTNHHDGNKRYRKMVEERKVDYVNSKRLDKPLVALDIIRQWRAQKPPGRFLKFDEKSDTWFDVGDKKAREKTSQALREKAPLLRKQQEEQRREMDVLPDMMGEPEEMIREVRFAVMCLCFVLSSRVSLQFELCTNIFRVCDQVKTLHVPCWQESIVLDVITSLRKISRTQ